MMTATVAPAPNLELESIQRLQRDLRRGARLTEGQARYMVDAYYSLQDFRIQSANQVRTAEETTEVVSWLFEQMRVLEAEVQKVLGYWAAQQPAGAWAQSIVGIGRVLSAGLAAHIDITQCPTVGHVWRFAGLDPTLTWERHQKRPYNARLKVLCWKIGDSFVKQSGRENDVYGHLYRQRKEQEVERNLAGAFADQAQASIDAGRIKDKATLAYYHQGQLPPGRLDLRARRWAVKMFLSHYHHVAYESHYQQPPPKPYAAAILGHAHIVRPPNWECDCP